MTPEELSYFNWDLEQWELTEVKDALRQANCGRLIPHSTVTRPFKSRYSPNNPVVPGEISAAAINLILEASTTTLGLPSSRSGTFVESGQGRARDQQRNSTAGGCRLAQNCLGAISVFLGSRL